MSELLFSDTITALATPPGLGGIAVIRLSGPDTLHIIKKLTRKSDFIPRYASNATIYEPQSGEIVDKLIITFFKGPNSYTGEDLAEISAHGGQAIIQQILTLLYQMGAREAKPGEFTRRAVLNGKMDLNQAEAVLDLIHAKTAQYKKNAVTIFQGSLSKIISGVHHILKTLAITLEYELDFNEDEINHLSIEQIQQQILNASQKLETLANSYRYGKILRDGINVTIIGAPNVGKSSLLNRILMEERAIVSDIPGTTRDYIVGEFEYKGLAFNIIDTAGLRDSDDPLESIGQTYTYKHIDEAQIILYMTDIYEKNPEIAISRFVKNSQDKTVILIINKLDLAEKKNFDYMNMPFPTIAMSIKYDETITPLLEMVYRYALPESILSYPFYITREWQYRNIKNALHHLNNAKHISSKHFTADIIAYETRSALECLSDLVGDYRSDDTINHIFSQFCVGK